jgi:hypothetical protein
VIETAINAQLANTLVNIHVEPKEDGDAWEEGLTKD